MNEIQFQLADGREDVRNALAGMAAEHPFLLRSAHPRARLEGDVVTWREYANTSTGCPVVDLLVYEVTVWAEDLDRLRKLTEAVNGAMLRLGLKRKYSSPDEFEPDATGYYTKTFRFGRKVDKRTMRLID